jgi:hypothetical protein
MTEPHTPPSHLTPTTNHEGDPEFQERHFVDPGPWQLPWPQPDAFTKPAPTYADATIEEVQAPGYVSGVSTPGQTPRESEFSWGLGNQNSLSKGPGPNSLEVLKAIQRTNPADPKDTAEAHYRDAGWVVEP